MLKEYFQRVKVKKPTYLRIKVIPKSAQNKVVEIMDDETIKIRINAAPEKGKANKELIKFLSDSLEIDKKNIEIISGRTDALKLIKIS